MSISLVRQSVSASDFGRVQPLEESLNRAQHHHRPLHHPANTSSPKSLRHHHGPKASITRAVGIRLFRVAAWAVIATLRCRAYVTGPAALTQRDRAAVADLYLRLSPVGTIRDLRNLLLAAGCSNVTDDTVKTVYVPRTFKFEGDGRPLSLVETMRVMSLFKRLSYAENKSKSDDSADAKDILSAMHEVVRSRSSQAQRGGTHHSSAANSGSATPQEVTFATLKDVMADFNVNLEGNEASLGSTVRIAPFGSQALTEADIMGLLAAKQTTMQGRLRRRRQSDAAVLSLPEKAMQGNNAAGDNLLSNTLASLGAGSPAGRSTDDPFESASAAFASEDSMMTDDRTWVEMEVDELRSELHKIQLPPATVVKAPQLTHMHSRNQPVNQTVKRKIFPKLHHRLNDYSLQEVCKIIDEQTVRGNEIAYIMRKAPKSNVAFTGNVVLPKVSAHENVSFLGLAKATGDGDNSDDEKKGGSADSSLLRGRDGGAAERQRLLTERLKHRRDTPVNREPPQWKKAFKQPMKIAEVPNLYTHVRSRGINRLAETPSFTLSADAKSVVIQAAVLEQQSRAATAMSMARAQYAASPQTPFDATCRAAAAAACRAMDKRHSPVRSPLSHPARPHTVTSGMLSPTTTAMIAETRHRELPRVNTAMMPVSPPPQARSLAPLYHPSAATVPLPRLAMDVDAPLMSSDVTASMAPPKRSDELDTMIHPMSVARQRDMGPTQQQQQQRPSSQQGLLRRGSSANSIADPRRSLEL